MKHQDQNLDWCVIDVAGYKKERMQKLQTIAENVVEEVLTSGKSKRISSYELIRENANTHFSIRKTRDYYRE